MIYIFYLQYSLKKNIGIIFIISRNIFMNRTIIRMILMIGAVV